MQESTVLFPVKQMDRIDAFSPFFLSPLSLYCIAFLSPFSFPEFVGWKQGTLTVVADAVAFHPSSFPSSIYPTSIRLALAADSGGESVCVCERERESE